MLADFGLARTITNDERADTICGTAAYIAPEVYVAMNSIVCAGWLFTILFQARKAKIRVCCRCVEHGGHVVPVHHK